MANAPAETRPLPVAPEAPKQAAGLCNLFGEPIPKGRSSACAAPENIVSIDKALKEQAKSNDSPIHDHVDEEPRDDAFDLSTYLTPGYYDYFQLHDAYLKACEAQVGAQFRLSICSQGKAQSEFWNTMLAAHHSKILSGEEHAPTGTISIAEAGPIDQNSFAKIGKPPPTPLTTTPPASHIGSEYHPGVRWTPVIVGKENKMTDQPVEQTTEKPLTDTFGPWAADPVKLEAAIKSARHNLTVAHYLGNILWVAMSEIMGVPDKDHLKDSTKFETPADFLKAVDTFIENTDRQTYTKVHLPKKEKPTTEASDEEGPHAEWVDDDKQRGQFFGDYQRRVWNVYVCTPEQADEQRKKTLMRLTGHDSLKWYNDTADHLLDELGLDFRRSEFKLKEQPPVESKPTEQQKPPAQSRPAMNGNGTKPAEQQPTQPTMSLVPAVINSPEMARFEVMRQQADVLLKSGFLPNTIHSPEQVIAIMMMGEAIGIKPIVALNTINVIQGKPTVSPQLMLALVRNSGQLENFSATDDGTTCTVKMKRKGETEHTETFSQADAAAMGLSSKDNWKKQPATMRKWRAIAAACRVVFPDVTWGEGRQAILARLHGGEPVKIEPEPDNVHDANALKVLVALDGQVHHVGYIPRELAKDVAPHLEGESMVTKVLEVTGGFERWDGEIASLGLRVVIEIPL
jgi:HIRAN domain